VRLAGIYSNPTIISGYGYNLLIYPVSDADIRIRISGEGDVRSQIQRISAYPYPTTAPKHYPDNHWLTACSSGFWTGRKPPRVPGIVARPGTTVRMRLSAPALARRYSGAPDAVNCFHTHLSFSQLPIESHKILRCLPVLADVSQAFFMTLETLLTHQLWTTEALHIRERSL